MAPEAMSLTENELSRSLDSEKQVTYLDSVPLEDPPKTTVVLSQVLLYNLHRFALATFVAAIGIAICVLVFTNGQELKNDYGASRTVMVPISALALLTTANKIFLFVRALRIAMKEHHNQKHARFKGIALSKCRVNFAIATSAIATAAAAAFLVVQAMQVQTACRRLNEGTLPDVDLALVVLYALVIAGGTVSLISSGFGAFWVLIFSGKLFIQRKRWYPLKIISGPEDLKPVYIL